MSLVILIAAAMLFAGATFLTSFLRSNPFLFIGYWCACGALTLFSVLLAIYDLIALRLVALRARRALRQRALDPASPPPDE